MSTSRRLLPSAAALFESMRDIGYSLETAVADLVDNSITAGATEIDIYCDLAMEEPCLVVIDNGCGMSHEKLLQAMTPGAQNPMENRDPKDLGRFGLGLKTASFSQCRQLTVVSSRKSDRVGAEWDLDTVQKEDDWMVSVLNGSEIEELPYVEDLPKTGTIVIWRKLDRVFERQSGSDRSDVVNEKLDVLEKHLALVFHRFLSGNVKGNKKLAIRINNLEIKPFDPFCTGNPATTPLPKEQLTLKGSRIRIQPYILPHHSQLSVTEFEFYKNRSDFLSNQGVYIYRNNRLMVWGQWFRLIPKGEATKLARVQIDFTNELDREWTIDIKKSKAIPPYEVRERIRQVIGRISEASIDSYRIRGVKKLRSKTKMPVWDRHTSRGSIRYELNSEHPLLEALKKELTEDKIYKLNAYIDSIAAALPIEMIYSDYSTHPRDVDQSRQLDNEEVIKKLRGLKGIVFSEGEPLNKELFFSIVGSTGLIDNYQEIVEKFIEDEF